MTFAATIVIAMAAVALLAADPALARSKGKERGATRCQPQAYAFSWYDLFNNTKPRPNGCAPAVFVGDQYIGQDPDPFIRSQLARDPSTGFSYDHMY